MAGGATLRGTVRRLNREHGRLPPFWLTEYSVLVQKKKLIGGDEILLERAKDFQAGLAAADLLITAIQEDFGGAYLFNLAQHGTWGVLGNPADFRLRPAGLAFSLLSSLAGQRRLPVEVDGASTVTLDKGDGTSPAKTSYATIDAVAAAANGVAQLVILNRSHSESARVRVELEGFAVARAEIDQLGPERLTAGNDETPDAVAIRRSAAPVAGSALLVPPRTVMRIVYRSR